MDNGVLRDMVESALSPHLFVVPAVKPLDSKRLLFVGIFSVQVTQIIFLFSSVLFIFTSSFKNSTKMFICYKQLCVKSTSLSLSRYRSKADES